MAVNLQLDQSVRVNVCSNTVLSHEMVQQAMSHEMV